jgi:hypothetical protein
MLIFKKVEVTLESIEIVDSFKISFFIINSIKRCLLV